MKVTETEIEIFLDDLREDVQKEFLKAQRIETSDEGNYDVVPIAIVPIPEIDSRKTVTHLVNHIGDSSTACGEDADEVKAKGDDITSRLMRTMCEKCLADYNYWKYKK